MAKASLVKKSSNVKFSNLMKGDIFQVGDDGFIKIFIDERRSQNAVNVMNGDLTRFGDDDEVSTDVRIVLE
jgi:hypothetical protein